MSIVSGQLVQTKISAGSVATFGQSLRTFVPEFQVCPVRPAFDYSGRSSAIDSLDTQTCPGAFPASLRIDVENSLRPFISPTYFNLPEGITGGGADMMFGQNGFGGRPNAFGFDVDINVPVTYGNQNNQRNEAAYSSYGQKNIGNGSISPAYGRKPYNVQPIYDRNN